jgi:hypothetical protein
MLQDDLRLVVSLEVGDFACYFNFLAYEVFEEESIFEIA